MNKPMTTGEADVAYECAECKEFPKALNRLRQFFKCMAGGAEYKARSIDLEYVANPTCDGDCVVGATSSVRCIKCKERIWFEWRANIPEYFKCPYCHETTFNPRAKNHNEMRADKCKKVLKEVYPK